MSEQKKTFKKKIKDNKKAVGVDIDKCEYQQIVLSQQNFPDRDFYR